MKKLVLLMLILIFTLSSFAASELDSLLKDDSEAFDELLLDENGNAAKDVLVEELIGQAFLQHDSSDKWLQIIEKTIIKEKDTVITMENSSMRVRMEDETFINVGSRTKLYFETLRGKPEEELISETGLKLAWGKVFSNVRKKLESGGKYEVEAGGIVAGVRGTQYLTSLTKVGEVSVKVYEGNVFVVPVEVHRAREAAKKKAASESTTETTTTETETEVVETTEEVVVEANEEISVSETGIISEITIHNETAPVSLETGNDITEEIKEIKEETKDKEVSTEEKKESSTEDNELLETVTDVEQQATSTVEEVDTSSSGVDVKVNIR